MPKRKLSTQADDAAGNAPPPRRSMRQKTSASTVKKDGEVAVSLPAAPKAKAKAPKAKTSSKPAPAVAEGEKQKEKGEDSKGASTIKTAKKSAVRQSKAATEGDGEGQADEGSAEGSAAGRRQYWLMKAEPETRYEKGKDISFSIDDLAARTEPEPWDGIRNYVARNNLRAMKKGDLAFFSHSNCKEPGIVGTMEIVQEHSPDLSAQNPKNPYYDPKSSPSDPRWSVVHVEFRAKFREPIKLKEMRELGKPGGPLENMQMLKQSRLSVSRVSEEEWNFLVALAEERGKATSSS